MITLPFIYKFALKKNYLILRRKGNKIEIHLVWRIEYIFGLIGAFIVLSIDRDLNLGIGDIYTLIMLSIGFFIIGFIDDLFNISPWPRLVIQITLASIVGSKILELNQ